ncbi:glycosyltransferase, group 1 family protein [Actinomyces urogenitalis DSM 15434]|uniref:Glycosyltransferase, group 1 family protein n=2 Tax=Actinomyces urogenitalis TaxID=103621 RepID=C0W3S7_9ACTO|nr:glycosyltransferase family 4 protein [Actinomyces urogenitalis]ETJ02117.1 MAG: Phosphatidylinositol alpha-mannosyltransferase [Actinomyces urogenitalis DORA_12]EEH66603.1 glycosyltransferase, group 1 family protein [Actinomyces urogenitalis DSM 15434]KGF03839.1 GDP-mannose-dependent alpha-(1-2)-phosphatidylinositol mannosyltransferase [Actinomyces urogenitalis S6-C4]MBS5976045.1 glycosyltransferase family 4 protein [Actinomyces urogenitalis]MDU0863262.1 glycosyltransferase family 4 protein 
MRIGLVCPYSMDAHGGVQVHVMDLAGELIRRGHEVQVLAPASVDLELPDWVTSAGDSVAIPYNGSVARLNFGALVARRARRWLEAGDFDLVHIHEPITPSVGMLVLQAAQAPVVATFHAAMDRSIARELVSPVMAPLLERITARIAVSEEARRTLVHFHGGDAVVIPNGVNVAPFASAPDDDPRFAGTDQAPTISFLGRLDEPRKGLSVLAGAIPTVLEAVPGARFLIAGRGEAGEVREQLAPWGEHVVFLGGVSDEDKAAMLASSTCYVAPQTGGESFGIVLVEAMAAGSHVIASDLTAFSDVLGQGRYGALFRNEDSQDLARVIVETLTNTEAASARRQAADGVVGRYDWSTVTDAVLDVYDMALSTAHTRVTAAKGARTVVGRIRDALEVGER